MPGANRSASGGRASGSPASSISPSIRTCAANSQIVDLTLAPKNADGKVEFWADFEMLVPVDRSQLNGALFYEVNNRGNQTAPGIFDGDADDFLLRQGFVVLWSGWIAEVHARRQESCTMSAPVATEDGQPIRGIVRNELVVDQPVAKMSISHRAGQGSYRPSKAGLAAATLTMREREADERQAIAAGQVATARERSDCRRANWPAIRRSCRWSNWRSRGASSRAGFTK